MRKNTGMKGMSIKSGDKRPTKLGAGMTAKGVAKYRRQNPGSKLQTAVTEKNPTGKRAARRKSYCARSAGQMKQFPKAAKNPNSRLRQARRRWKCKMTRQLTEKQQKFLDVLFDQAGGDIGSAIKLAGYAEGVSPSQMVTALKEEILEATQTYMARNAPKAAVAITSSLDDPTQLGIRDRMSAARELLDRTGLIKTEKVQVETSGGVMLMPPKNKEEI